MANRLGSAAKLSLCTLLLFLGGRAVVGFLSRQPSLQNNNGLAWRLEHAPVLSSSALHTLAEDVDSYDEEWIGMQTDENVLNEARENIQMAANISKLQNSLRGYRKFQWEGTELPNVADITLEWVDANVGNGNTQQMVAAFVALVEKYGDLVDFDPFVQNSSVTNRIEDIRKSSTMRRERVASITLGLDERLLHGLDLKNFARRLEATFDWFDDAAQGIQGTTIAPYIPVIQSSGVGKTKLFFSLKKTAEENNWDFSVKTILFDITNVEENSEASEQFDGLLVVPPGNRDNDRDNILEQLDDLVADAPSEKVVVLFDESQHLFKSGGQNTWAFRVVRWWLRKQVPKHRKKVVAVFAGTTQQIAAFNQDPPESTTSRDGSSGYYDNFTALPTPFHSILTFGIFQNDHKLVQDLQGKSDFERSLVYGRPLFAAMLKAGQVTSSSETNIVSRMLTGDTTQSWMESTEVCLSVFSARVHMGDIVPQELSNKLVAKSYAYLAGYQDGRSMIRFLADPMIARLAMALMHDEYRGEEVTTHRGSSLGEKFWLQKAVAAYRNGLAVPEKGNVGEIGLGYYMLRCGDKLRFCVDEQLRTFSIPLDSLIRQMEQPTNDDDIHLPEDFKETEAQVSFIQITQQYLRYRQNAWPLPFARPFLKALYASAHAQFMPPNYPAYDMLGSVKYFKGEEKDEDFCPLLVQFKAQDEFTLTDTRDALGKMKKALNETFGVGLLVLGSSDSRNRDKALQEVTGNASITVALQKEQCEKFTEGKDSLFFIVRLPDDEPFGVRDFVERSTLFPWQSEIEASHPTYRIHSSSGTQLSDDVVQETFRSNAKKDQRESLQSLWEDMDKYREGQ